MNKKLTIPLIIAIMVVVGLIFAVWLFRPVEYVPHEPIELDPESLPGYLSSLQLVDDLPENSKVQLYFGDNNYYIQNGIVVEGQEENPDVVISVPEEYIDRIGEVGACQAVSEALGNGDLILEKELSDGDLLWKYKGMIRYKDCLGL